MAPFVSSEEAYFDEDDDGLYFDAGAETFQESVSSFLKLRESTGSEILQSDLQQQIDEAVEVQLPNVFLDKHAEGASQLEKMAMSSVTEQLPQRAVQALQREVNKKTEGKGSQRKKSRASLDFVSGNRVTQEQEIQLARIIQDGAALCAVRTKAEEELGREISRQEWAERAGLKSAKELRRRVSDYRRAKHHLVSANVGLVHAVVNQQWPSLKHATGVSKEELIQEGSLGLLRAAELFDPSRGLRFSTYAVVWIKGTLSNSHVRELVRLPSREKTKWNKIVQARKELEEAGEEVQPERLAQMTGLPIEQIMATHHRMNQARRMMSLDYEYATQSRSGTESSSSINVLEKDKAMQADGDLAERTQLHADIIAAMTRNLDAREARLLRLRYGLSDGRARTLHECAEAMGLSYTRVHQLANRCLKKLRQAKEAEALEEYLLTIA